jgi:molybdopterin-containing oxidoreductase family membrane subunit
MSAQRRWITGEIKSTEQINQIVIAPILATKPDWRWWTAFGISGAFTLLMLVTVAWLFGHGIGIFGNNTTIVWGFPIANYVWWLGIGHAGTLISALLLLTRQKWRGSLNRFAETMTLFAASMAGHALSQCTGTVAAMAQCAGVGFLGGRHLHHVFSPVLVCWPGP